MAHRRATNAQKCYHKRRLATEQIGGVGIKRRHSSAHLAALATDVDHAVGFLLIYHPLPRRPGGGGGRDRGSGPGNPAPFRRRPAQPPEGGVGLAAGAVKYRPVALSPGEAVWCKEGPLCVAEGCGNWARWRGGGRGSIGTPGRSRLSLAQRGLKVAGGGQGPLPDSIGFSLSCKSLPFFILNLLVSPISCSNENSWPIPIPVG